MLILEKIKDEFYAINLPNVNINGDVCFGTTMSVTPEERIEDIMQRYFDAFWKTSFNSHSDSTGYKWQGKTFTYKARVNLSPIRITL
jgi:allophanate hydrolase subunit 2